MQHIYLKLKTSKLDFYINGNTHGRYQLIFLVVPKSKIGKGDYSFLEMSKFDFR